jgi:hypothetical protein
MRSTPAQDRRARPAGAWPGVGPAEQGPGPGPAGQARPGVGFCCCSFVKRIGKKDKESLIKHMTESKIYAKLVSQAQKKKDASDGQRPNS